MNQFEIIKAAVTLRQAAEHYGLTVGRNGMTCCPFHKDRYPSLKLNEDYFFCFGCGASGDVIDFTGRLFGISLKDAAEKLAADFNISANTKLVATRQNPSRLDELRCRRVLTDYCIYCRNGKTEMHPGHQRIVWTTALWKAACSMTALRGFWKCWTKSAPPSAAKLCPLS